MNAGNIRSFPQDNLLEAVEDLDSHQQGKHDQRLQQGLLRTLMALRSSNVGAAEHTQLALKLQAIGQAYARVAILSNAILQQLAILPVGHGRADALRQLPADQGIVLDFLDAVQLFEGEVRRAPLGGGAISDIFEKPLTEIVRISGADRIEGLQFSDRTYNCLKKAGVLTVHELTEISEFDLMNIRNFGRKSLAEVKEKLGALGLKLKDEPESSISAEHANTRIEELDFSVRTYTCLKKLGWLTIGELTQASELELMGIENFEQPSLVEVKEKLAALGLRLKDG